VHLEWLKLYQYRNLADTKASFSPHVNFIFGRNGQGKTNLVEAIALLSAARSFRTQSMAEVVRWGEQSASVFAALSGKLGDEEVGLAIEAGQRRAFLNGSPVRSMAEFVGRLVSVSFSPTDLAIIKGAPQGRRRFVDRHLIDLEPRLMGEVLEYSRALRNKAALLKQGQAGPGELEPWNALLARSGAAIIAARRRLLAMLEAKSEPLYRTIAAGEGSVQLTLETNVEEGAGESVEGLYSQLMRAAPREAKRRAPLIGPHRDDVRIDLSGHDSRAFASQGQSRSLVLALKLATIELIEEHRGESPVVLLDDVDSELDQTRSNALFELVYSAPRQVFVTGTDRDAVTRLRHTDLLEMEIADGQIMIK